MSMKRIILHAQEKSPRKILTKSCDLSEGSNCTVGAKMYPLPDGFFQPCSIGVDIRHLFTKKKYRGQLDSEIPATAANAERCCPEMLFRPNFIGFFFFERR